MRLIRLQMKKFILAAAAALLLLTACRHAAQDNGKTVFRYNESAGITSLDPAFARDQANIWACQHLYNGLVQVDEHLRVQPCIATRWQIAEDGLTYTFFLRQDVKFHDCDLLPKDRHVTAHDFVYSFNRVADPKTTSPGSWVFSKLDTLPNGKLACQALNDSTLQLQLREPFPPLLGLLSMQYCSVVPYEVVKHFGNDFRVHPVGTGPFRLRQWKEGVKLVLLKNQHYFERDSDGVALPYLDAVAISFITDKQSAFMEFVKGNLDFLSGLDASYKDELLDKQGHLRRKYARRFKLQSTPYLNTEYLGILMENPDPSNPLSKKEIRQAINYGFDRAAMIRHLRNNIGTPATSGITAKGLPSFDDKRVPGYAYDPKRAAQLLAKAGYPGGKGLPPIHLSTVPSYLDLCQYIQYQLGTLGINIILDVNPPATQRELMAKQKLSLFRASWIADYPDAENYLSLFFSPNFAPAGPNYTHYRHPEYDRLYRQAIKTTNDEERYKIYQQMEKILIDDAPFVPLYYDQVLRFTPLNISGLGINPINLLVLKNVRKTNPRTKK